MRIFLASVLVDDQEKALQFYTDVLGFNRKQDIPMGKARWLTVVSPEGHDDVQLLLEPNNFAPSRTYQKALYDAGIAATVFAVTDIHGEYERMKAAGVSFKAEPTEAGPATVAVFDDTCGNLIQMAELSE